MNVIPVTDLDDPRLDPYRDLRREDVRRRGALFIAEGRLVAQRLLASRYETVSVLAEAKRLPWVAERIAAATPVLVISPDGMRELSGFNFHRGLLACGRRIPMHPSETLLQDQAESSDPAGSGSVALGVIAVSDAENLGSLIRTAAAFGISRLVLSRQTIDPLCRRVLRVSMGTVLGMRIFDLADPLGWLTDNERLGRWFTIATTLEPGAIPLSHVVRHPEFDRRPKMVLMGNEGDGLPAEISRACTVRGVIPMASGIDSLNVAVAGGIAIYELFRHEHLSVGVQ